MAFSFPSDRSALISKDDLKYYELLDEKKKKCMILFVELRVIFL
jgi:hypothetical protein